MATVGPTLTTALAQAIGFWATKRGSKVMESRANVCCRLLGTGWGSKDIHKLTRKDAIELLALLARKGLSRKTQTDYYQTFRRMLRLNGRDTHDWPTPPVAPRKTREGLSQADYNRMVIWLLERGFSETAEVALLLAACGLRIGVECLRPGALRVERGDSYDIVHVCGKGEHERPIPVTDPEARALLVDEKRLADMRSVPYATHLWRWNRARAALGIKSKLASPHSIRHKYATELLDRSGGNLVLVQEMLGHANPGTTAKYIDIPMDQKAKALQPKEPTKQ